MDHAHVFEKLQKNSRTSPNLDQPNVDLLKKVYWCQFKYHQNSDYFVLIARSMLSIMSIITFKHVIG